MNSSVQSTRSVIDVDGTLQLIGNASVLVTPFVTESLTKVGQIFFSDSAALDLTNNPLIVDYDAPLIVEGGASPLADVVSYLVSGYNGGAWNGPGIRSSTAATNANFALGVAEAFEAGLPEIAGHQTDSSTVIVRYTLRGDTNLDRVVDFADLLAVARNFNATGGWTAGDSNYDGQVNFNDLLSLARNFGQSIGGPLLVAGDASAFTEDFLADWNLARSVVPEPAALSAVIAFATLTLRRRR